MHDNKKKHAQLFKSIIRSIYMHLEITIDSIRQTDKKSSNSKRRVRRNWRRWKLDHIYIATNNLNKRNRFYKRLTKKKEEKKEILKNEKLQLFFKVNRKIERNIISILYISLSSISIKIIQSKTNILISREREKKKKKVL